MKVLDSDIHTAYLAAALAELNSGDTYQQYGSLLYIACCVASGDSNSLDILKNLVIRGKELIGPEVVA